MPDRVTRRPSPALVVAMIALVVASATTAGANPRAIISALTSAKVKKIAGQEVTRKAPKLSVAHADNADRAVRADSARRADTATHADAATTADTVASATTATSAAGAAPTGIAAGALTGAFPAPGLAVGAAGPTTLAPAAITAAKLADGGVATKELSDGAVTAGKLADGSVHAQQLEDHAVGAGQLADGSVTGPKVASGAAGARTLGPFSYVISQPFHAAQNTIVTASASCPVGTRLVNAGTEWEGAQVALDVNKLHLLGLGPDTTDPDGRRALAIGVSALNSNTISLYVELTCLTA
jgi:hypothetical protein